MEWALLSIHFTLTPVLRPTTIPYSEQCQQWLRPTTIPYSEQCQPWSWPSYQCTLPYSVRLSGLHPTPCATPYNYSLQCTVSTMVWALLFMHSTLLSTIEWTPPYPLCYVLQLFLTVNSVNHGVGPLINAPHPTLYD